MSDIARNWKHTYEDGTRIDRAEAEARLDDLRVECTALALAETTLRGQLAGAVGEIERLRDLVCTCEYLIDFENGSPPQHRPGCPAIPPTGGQ